jgi:hypothetical protein
MPISTVRDFYFEVSAGNIPGHRAVHKFGHNPDANSAGVFWPLWEGSAAGALTTYPGFDATEVETVSFVSTVAADTGAGTGARTVEVFGLGLNWTTQSEIITLNGITPVLTTKEYVRMDRAIVRSAGSGGANAGTIVGSQSSSGHAFVNIAVGDNQTMQAVFTIPEGEKGLLIYQEATTNRQQASGAAEVRLRVRPDGEVFQVKEPFDATVGGGVAGRPYNLPKDTLFARTDMYLETASSSTGIGVTGGFDLVLIKTE